MKSQRTVSSSVAVACTQLRIIVVEAKVTKTSSSDFGRKGKIANNPLLTAWKASKPCIVLKVVACTCITVKRITGAGGRKKCMPIAHCAQAYIHISV